MPLFAALHHLKAALDALRPLAQEQQLQQQLEWAYYSQATADETALTPAETRALLLHGRTAAGKLLSAQSNLQHHYQAGQQLDEWVQNRQPLTRQFIEELHATLLGLPPSATSAYKSAPNHVLTAEGRTLYATLPQDVPARLADLLAWYQRETLHSTQHPLALAAQLHHRLARIRPFATGNGRLTRLLLNLPLLQHGYPLVAVPAAERARYQAASAAAAGGTPEPFLHFLTELVTDALRRQLRAAKGEATGDADELHEKLALLKQQVLGGESAVKTLWNETMQAGIYEALVRPWLTNLVQQTQEFDELFMSRGYGGRVEATLPRPLVLEEVGDWETFEAHLHSALTITVADMQAVHFASRWLHFRQRNNGFDAGLQVDFHFHPDHFVIRHAVVGHHGADVPAVQWQAEVCQGGYPPSLDEPTMRATNYQLATRLYDFIAAQATPTNSAL